MSFARTAVRRIKFIDEHHNIVVIETKNKYKYVGAFITRGYIGAGQLVNLPINYVHYDLFVRTLSHADINALEQWRMAKTIGLLVDSMPSVEIIGRIFELSTKLPIQFNLSNMARLEEDLKT